MVLIVNFSDGSMHRTNQTPEFESQWDTHQKRGYNLVEEVSKL